MIPYKSERASRMAPGAHLAAICFAAFILLQVYSPYMAVHAQEIRAAETGPEGIKKIFNRHGTEMGSIDEKGNVLNISGILMGSVDSEGNILNGNGVDVGKVTSEGNVMNQSGTVLGSVNGNGEIFNVSGSKMGEVKGETDIKRTGAAARLIFLK